MLGGEPLDQPRQMLGLGARLVQQLADLGQREPSPAQHQDLLQAGDGVDVEVPAASVLRPMADTLWTDAASTARTAAVAVTYPPETRTLQM
ncbi:hypothetical protein GCM10027060_23570 [Nesterenkonia halophila]